MKNVLALTMFLLLGVIPMACTRPHSVGPSVVPTATHITAQYNYYAWLLCDGVGEPILTYEKLGDKYTMTNECTASGETSSGEITGDTFKIRVYADDYFTSRPDESYAEIPSSSVSNAPSGTTHCYQTSDGVNTICRNDSEVITFQDFKGHLVGVYDGDWTKILKSYSEE